MTLPAVEKRKNKKSYNNFNVAIFCPVGNINNIDDFDDFDRRFEKAFGGIKVGRVYLEDFRGKETISKERLLQVKEYFEKKGIETSGAITTCAPVTPEFGFASLCYSSEEDCDFIKEAVKLNAEIFDEFIFDDFYFINCRCPKCIEKKDKSHLLLKSSWSQFRLEQKKWVTENLIMKPAKAINPDVNVIVKFPQWYEDFNETGYDLDTDTSMFDTIYTGTETRNPSYAQQHLPKYLSYNTMRLYGSNKPGVNLGAWFDPYECTYNLTSYIEQGYLSLFGKADEVTLFCLGSLMDDPMYRLFPAVCAKMFEEVDEYMGLLGNPVGAGAYHPSNGIGEKNLHSYLGQSGIPMEMTLEYPANSKSVFLAESAANDSLIIHKMKKTLMAGGDVIVTSGFVKALGDDFLEFANIKVTDKKAFVKNYCYSKNHGVNILGNVKTDKDIIIPQLDYCTNDTWEIAGAYGNDNNFPVILSFSYANGSISVITIPDDMGDIYAYPTEVLNLIRGLFSKELKVSLDAPAGVQLYLYDNDYFIVRSDLPYEQDISLVLTDKNAKIEAINYHHTLSSDMERTSQDNATSNGSKISFAAAPGVNYIYKICSQCQAL